jgi:hypothetical protein
MVALMLVIFLLAAVVVALVQWVESEALGLMLRVARVALVLHQALQARL